MAPVQLVLPGVPGAIEHHVCVRCGQLRAPLGPRREGDRSCLPWCRRCAPTQRGQLPDHMTRAARDANTAACERYGHRPTILRAESAASVTAPDAARERGR